MTSSSDKILKPTSPKTGKAAKAVAADLLCPVDQFTSPTARAIIDYCTEEVVRQGHDVSAPEGFKRVGWMLEAWSFMAYVGEGCVSLAAIEELDRMVEPGKNEDGFRTCHVRVGNIVMPHWVGLSGLLNALLARQEELAPLDFYRGFLEIHPFADGNGRVGKILLNWKNGTLLKNPVFPPDDFWGAPIFNP